MRILLILITATLLFAQSATASALSRVPDNEVGVAPTEPTADSGLRQAGCTSLNQAVEQVRRQYKGRIVSAETQVRLGRQSHVIKVLTSDGTVKTVRIRGCRV